jgi:hypothetical protein
MAELFGTKECADDKIPLINHLSRTVYWEFAPGMHRLARGIIIQQI